MKDFDSPKRLPPDFTGLPDEEAVRLIMERYANAKNNEQWARFFLAVSRGEIGGDPARGPVWETREPVVGTLLSLNVGRSKPLERRGRFVSSAIFKTPVEGDMWLSQTGLEGDEQADLRVHGGPDKAVCVYSVENLPRWSEILGASLSSGAFGENFSVEGMTESDVYIGDVYEAGGAFVQVSQPRRPCFKLAVRHGLPEMALLVQESGKTGFYLRCLDGGAVRKGDEITLFTRPERSVSIAEANRIMYRDEPDVAAAERLLVSPGLSASWRRTLEKQLSGKNENQSARLEGNG